MSSRRPFLAGNWKMHKNLAEAVALATELRDLVGPETERDVAVFPALTALSAVRDVLADSPIRVGAQTCHFEVSGAFTGEVSAEMLSDAGCDLVLVGHSERRQLFGETDGIVRKKLEAALRAGLDPVVCVGETIDERQAEQMEEVVRRQVRSAFVGLDPAAMERVTLAYEPVWAIGTGLTASPTQAQEAHAFIRGLLAELFPGGLAERLRIQYGGSVKPNNIVGLMQEPDLDGALVGGASLDAGSFARIVAGSIARTGRD